MARSTFPPSKDRDLATAWGKSNATCLLLRRSVSSSCSECNRHPSSSRPPFTADQVGKSRRNAMCPFCPRITRDHPQTPRRNVNGQVKLFVRLFEIHHHI